MWEYISHTVTSMTPENVLRLVLFRRFRIVAKSIH